MKEVAHLGDLFFCGNYFLAEHQQLTLVANVKKNGYLYTYVSNETSNDINAFFDDFKITYTNEVEVIRFTDYYPYGSVMREAGEKYRFGYQGEFAEQDDETGWNAFELRMYDSKIGRWMSPDPYGQYWSPYVGMGNNPVSGIDPDGGFCPNCSGSESNPILLDEFVFSASKMTMTEKWAYDKAVGGGVLGGFNLFTSELFGWRSRSGYIYPNSLWLPFQGNGIGFTVFTPSGGVFASLDRVYTIGDGREDLFLTMGGGYGLDVSADVHLTSYSKVGNAPLLSSDISGFTVHHTNSIGAYSYLRSYSLTQADDGRLNVGNVTGDSFGFGPSVTFPFIINGGFGIGYTFNLSDMKRHYLRPNGAPRKR